MFFLIADASLFAPSRYVQCWLARSGGEKGIPMENNQSVDFMAELDKAWWEDQHLLHAASM